MTNLTNAYIVSACRTPVGKAPRGCFQNTRPDDLLAALLKAVIKQQPELDPNSIDDVIIGCAMPEAQQGMNVARISTLLAGLPVSVPGMTVNRFCSSGIQTVADAFNRIQTGAAEVIIAGGVESMSMVPMGGNELRPNLHYFTNQNGNIAIAYGMGITAEKVAKKWEVSREAQDEFALNSHEKALNAQKNGHFDQEIIPMTAEKSSVDLQNQKIIVQNKTLSADEGPRADTSIEALAKLKPVFSNGGSVTAGNSSQMSDGAGAVLVVSEKALKKYNLTPIATLKSYAVVGVEPEYMGIGPSKAIPKALKMADMQLDSLNWIELNEAFAAQSLAVMKSLELNPAVVNPSGGAIALGHPLGATGAIRIATLLHGLKRTQKKCGMVTMCVGTGMGAAGIFEIL